MPPGRRESTIRMCIAIQSSGWHSAHDDDQPSSVVAPLCWLDSCSEKRRTVAHTIDCEIVVTLERSNFPQQKRGTTDCEAVGTLGLSNCPTAEGGCLLEDDYILKLAPAYDRDLAVNHD